MRTVTLRNGVGIFSGEFTKTSAVEIVWPTGYSADGQTEAQYEIYH